MSLRLSLIDDDGREVANVRSMQALEAAAHLLLGTKDIKERLNFVRHSPGSRVYVRHKFQDQPNLPRVGA